MKQITFDNTSITNAVFQVKKITSENADSVELNMYDLARQRGGFIVNRELRPRTITITGNITGSSASNLEEHIDEIKELFSRRAKNLDIQYASGTRRFVATCSSMTVNRDYYHVTFAPYEATFVIPAGVGYATSETVEDITGITDLVYSGSVTIAGTATPKPRITITIQSETDVTAFNLLANGEKMTIEDTFTAGDVIVINENTMKVTLNGDEHDFLGKFPSVIIGLNAFAITTTGTDVEYDLNIAYTKTYC